MNKWLKKLSLTLGILLLISLIVNFAFFIDYNKSLKWLNVRNDIREIFLNNSSDFDNAVELLNSQMDRNVYFDINENGVMEYEFDTGEITLDAEIVDVVNKIFLLYSKFPIRGLVYIMDIDASNYVVDGSNDKFLMIHFNFWKYKYTLNITHGIVGIGDCFLTNGWVMSEIG